MKRNWNLLRDMLMDLEHSEQDGLFHFDTNKLSRSVGEIEYHKVLLTEFGLVIGTSVLMSSGKREAAITGITREGHDFMDLIRNPLVWRKIEVEIAKFGGLPIYMIEDIARALIRKKIDL